MSIAAKITDLACYIPDNVLSNDYLEQIFPTWSAEKIYEKTGIRNRPVAAEGQTAGDLAFEAAQNLFSQGKIKADDVDFVILCTQAPDYVLPTTACILQYRLGIPSSSGALDVNLGCSGFVYCLSLAKGLIESGSAKCVLVLTADTYSKYIHPLDKSVRTLFGDAAAAVAVTAAENQPSAIGPFIFGTDGEGAKNLIVEAGGFRTPYSSETAETQTDASENVRTREHLYMNGPEIMTFALREVPRSMKALLAKANMQQEDIDYFVLHQANRFMLETLRRRLRIEPERLPIHVEELGNTVSSTIPLTLLEMRRQGCFETPKKLMLIGFGVGYSWCAGLVTI